MGELRTLLDEAVANQRQMTAVDSFARAHALGEIRTPRYRDLIPLSLPKAGEQFAFEVDLDKCSGCKACVAACHALNGLDDHESWREVGVLISDDWRRPVRQTVPTACHHCVDPACLSGCPVLAYEKDVVTGIVRHLDDQCIGCQYCVMMCPYEVPKYSAQRGIVRKCDMCRERLADGEAPACVQACPGEAIRIAVVRTETLVADFREAHSENSFLPSSPDPAITVPATRFVARQPLAPDLIASDAATRREQPPHWPLVWMLVLTQLGVGASLAASFASSSSCSQLVNIALIATAVGLVASVAHLGQPTKAWRAFLGLRTSWLSREIVAFGLFATLLSVATISVISGSSTLLNTDLLITDILLPVTALIGLLAVGCSAFVYHATQRVFWIGLGSFGKFYGTVALLGAAAWWIFSITALPAILLALVAMLKLAVESNLLRRANESVADDVAAKTGNFNRWSLAKTAMLLRDRFGLVMRARVASLIICGVILPCVSFVVAPGAVWFPAVAFAGCLVGEIVERYLFFRAVVPPRMPGGS